MFSDNKKIVYSYICLVIAFVSFVVVVVFNGIHILDLVKEVGWINEYSLNAVYCLVLAILFRVLSLLLHK